MNGDDNDDGRNTSKHSSFSEFQRGGVRGYRVQTSNMQKQRVARRLCADPHFIYDVSTSFLISIL